MPPFQVRDFPQDTYERLRRCAEKERRSIAQQAVWIIERYLDAYENIDSGYAPLYHYNPEMHALEPIETTSPPTVTEAQIRLICVNEMEKRREKRRRLFAEIKADAPKDITITTEEIVSMIREDRDNR